MSHRIYFDLISGQAPRYIGIPGRLALRVLSWPYRAVVRLRNHLYSSGWLEAHEVNAVVISVGNLTTGGTGKTPLVVWLCRLLRERHLRCAILTRGYKTPRGKLSDEPAMLTVQCPGIPVVVNPDRVEGAAAAICEHDARVLVMDDGFQHRRLARDLDIVTIDATSPFGYERLLPAGLLREPIRGLERAHAVVLTRCNQASGDALQQIEEALRWVKRDLVIVRSIHAPASIQTVEGKEISLETVNGCKVFAFCGLGNPQAFFRTIEHLGGVLVGSRVFDDHYQYTAANLTELHEQADKQQAGLILTTQKDWTRVTRLPLPQGHPPLAHLAVELRITTGAQELTTLIDRVLGGKMANL